MPSSVRDFWALFGNDLEAAQQSILEALKKQQSHLHLLHLAISCGLHDTIQSIADSDDLSIGDRATLNYRLQLLQGNERTAFRAIIHDQLATYTSNAIQQSLKTGIPLDIKMLGGIGDHLEALSIMNGWCIEHGMTINLHIQKSRIQQLERLTKRLPWVASLTPYGDQKVFSLFNSLRRFIYETNTTHVPQSLTKRMEKQNFDALCCWRAVGGVGEKFSIHSRSVPFQTAYTFYQAIFKQKPNATITDITQWKPWEKTKLLQLGIHLHDPAHGDVNDLAAIAASHHQIISIDTALAHLCAVNNIKANLILTMFPDERWNFLLKEGSCYATNLTIFQQESFGNWSSTMKRLSQSIHKNLPR